MSVAGRDREELPTFAAVNLRRRQVVLGCSCLKGFSFFFVCVCVCFVVVCFFCFSKGGFRFVAWFFGSVIFWWAAAGCAGSWTWSEPLGEELDNPGLSLFCFF